MPAIPTISRTEVPANQIGAVRVDPNAFSAQGRSLVAAGQAISQTAQVVGVIAQRRQDHVDRGLLANEETVRMNTVATVQEYMDQNQDRPETWSKFEADAWTGYEAGRDKRIREQAWTTRASDEDKIQYQAYKTQASIHFKTAQNMALIRKSNAQIEANAEFKLRNGDLDGAVAAYGQMDLAPDKKIELVKRATQKADWYGVMHAINNDPAAAVQMLEDETPTGRPKNFTNLDEAQRYSVMQSARGALASRQNEFQTDIAQRSVLGEKIADSEIDSAVAMGLVKPTWARAFKAQQLRDTAKAGPTPEQIRQAHGIFAKIDRFDPEAAGFEGRFALQSEILTLPEGYRTQAQKQFDDQLRPDSPGRNPVAAEFFKNATKDYNDGLFLPGVLKSEKIPGTGFFFGKRREIIESEATPPRWRETLSREKIDAADEHFAGYLTKMRAFFRENPKATDLQAQEYSRELKKPYVMNAVVQSLSMPAATVTQPKEIKTQAEFDVLKQGDPFIFNGKIGAKK